jgi:hypothetical protein
LLWLAQAIDIWKLFLNFDINRVTFLADSSLLFCRFFGFECLVDVSLLSPLGNRSRSCWTTSEVVGAIGRGVLMLTKLFDLKNYFGMTGETVQKD